MDHLAVTSVRTIGTTRLYSLEGSLALLDYGIHVEWNTLELEFYTSMCPRWIG